MVDLLIPTYNEELSVTRGTVYAALGIDWPKDKLRIHLLDDGNRPSFKTFAEEVGITTSPVPTTVTPRPVTSTMR